MRRIALLLPLLACAKPEYSETCESYLACVQAAEPDQYTSLNGAYGPDSSCWDDQKSADACQTNCQLGLDAAAESYPDVAECAGG